MAKEKKNGILSKLRSSRPTSLFKNETYREVSQDPKSDNQTSSLPTISEPQIEFPLGESPNIKFSLYTSSNPSNKKNHHEDSLEESKIYTNGIAEDPEIDENRMTSTIKKLNFKNTHSSISQMSLAAPSADMSSEELNFQTDFGRHLKTRAEIAPILKILSEQDQDIADIFEMEEFEDEVKTAAKNIQDSNLISLYRQNPKFRASEVYVDDTEFSNQVSARKSIKKQVVYNFSRTNKEEEEFYTQKIFIFDDNKIQLLEKAKGNIIKLRKSLSSLLTKSQNPKTKPPTAVQEKEVQKEPFFPQITEFRPVLLESIEKHDDKLAMDKIKEQREHILRSNLNQSMIFRRAFMKDANTKAIEEVEDEYFQSIYGEWYLWFKRQAPTSMINLYDIENRLIVQLTRITRSLKIPTENFVETLFAIEENLNGKLLRKGSVGKILFQSRKNKWFVLQRSTEQSKIGISYVKNGPWNYYDSIFKDKQKVYKAKNILYTDYRSEKARYVARFSESLNIMASSFLKCCSFKNFSPTTGSWNLYALPFESTDPKQRIISLLKSFKEDKSVGMLDVMRHSVRRCLFLSVNLVSKHKKEAKKETQRPKSISHLVRKRIVKDEIKNLTDDEGDSEDALNAIKLEDVEINEDPYTQDFLPTYEFLEFLYDMRDTMNNYNPTLFEKVSSFFIKNRVETKKKKLEDLEIENGI